jgi:hypothetical protein
MVVGKEIAIHAQSALKGRFSGEGESMAVVVRRFSIAPMMESMNCRRNSLSF